jgi:2,3-diketo-5-methylthiopentyl-1-phosphate enolase
MKQQLYEDLNALPIALAEAVDPEDQIIATYLAQYPKHIDMREMGQALAVEQSTGTWTPVPGETAEVRCRHVAKLIGMWETPDYAWEIPAEVRERRYIIQIAFPLINIGSQLPMVFTAAIGNISMFGKLKLVDLRFPKKYVDGFNGPKFGIEGMRKLLDAPKRPLINIMMKPCTGWTAEWGQGVFREVAMGGVDIIKDDELIANASFNTIAERVKLFMEAERQVYEATGEHTLYAVNVTDSIPQVFDNARRAIDAGANCLMVNYLANGISVLQALAQDPQINVPILGHCDVAGVYYASPDHGISAPLILGKLPRLAGADMVVYPYYQGKVALSKDQCLHIGRNLTFPFYDINPAWPMPGGGIYPYLVPQLVEEFGLDVMIGAGGGVHAHPMGPTAGARAFRQIADAVAEGRPVDEVACEHKELRVALDTWRDPYKELAYASKC